jgi:hypothetical protein
MSIRIRPLVAPLLLAASIAWAQQVYIPDHNRTPGAINPEITQENIARTVCVSGYAKTIRPPRSYTSRLKAKQIRELSLPGGMHDYHEDHLVPLCVWRAPEGPAQHVASAGQW